MTGRATLSCSLIFLSRFVSRIIEEQSQIGIADHVHGVNRDRPTCDAARRRAGGFVLSVLVSSFPFYFTAFLCCMGRFIDAAVNFGQAILISYP